MKTHQKESYVKQIFELFDKEDIPINDRSKILSCAYRDNRKKILSKREIKEEED